MTDALSPFFAVLIQFFIFVFHPIPLLIIIDRTSAHCFKQAIFPLIREYRKQTAIFEEDFMTKLGIYNLCIKTESWIKSKKSLKKPRFGADGFSPVQ